MTEVTSTLSSLQAAYTTNTTAATTVSASDDKSLLSDNFDSFLLLLTTQMTNQDPLQPMDSSEFTNQLVMFAQAEQSVKQSGLLEDLLANSNLSQSIGAVGYIGMDVITPSNKFQTEASAVDGTGKATEIKDEILTYYLPKNAATATMTIYDSAGVKVFTGELEGTAGEYNVTWDGTKDDGTITQPGAYSFSVSAKDSNGDAISGITTATRGKVTNVRYDGTVTELTLDGTRKITIDKVTGIGLEGSI